MPVATLERAVDVPVRGLAFEVVVELRVGDVEFPLQRRRIRGNRIDAPDGCGNRSRCGIRQRTTCAAGRHGALQPFGNHRFGRRRSALAGELLIRRGDVPVEVQIHVQHIIALARPLGLIQHHGHDALPLRPEGEEAVGGLLRNEFRLLQRPVDLGVVENRLRCRARDHGRPRDRRHLLGDGIGCRLGRRFRGVSPAEDPDHQAGYAQDLLRAHRMVSQLCPG